MKRRFPMLAAALIALASLLHAAPAAAQPQQKPRVIQQFTTGWKFLQADAPGAEKPAFDDSAWMSVTLPHDWSIAGPFKEDAPSRGAGAFAPTGIGWYRKTFTVPDADATPTAARRTYIVFDGVMANSDVYLNGELLGHRPYGYVSFYYELTPHLHPGQNTISVRVDDSQHPASRWYPGAGINRQVRLVTTSDAHIVPWGTFVTTPSVSAASATIHVRSTVTTESAAPVNLTLRVRLTGPNGAPVLATKVVSSASSQNVAPGANADLDAEMTLPKPDRWDLDHPVLYTVHTMLLRDGKAVDDEDVPFGIREFHFDPDKGFFLNGVHHKVYGVALHTDGGAVGTAVPLGVWERRLTELRKLGVNAIRTAHNPPAPEFLDLADRMGFLIMDEMFDCWTVAKNPYDYHLYFKDWNIRDTTDTVMRDRNHPSIILWSAGNEIHDTPKPDIAIPILTALVKTFHKNDPTRPVTQALFRPNVSHDYDNGLADLLDVVGQNYREQEILAAHAQKPTRKIIGTENAHDRNQWIAMRDHPEYSGQFLWSGIDYLGESRTWPTIGSGSGLLNRTGAIRPLGLERASWWGAAPMVGITRRVATTDLLPTDPGYGQEERHTQVLFSDWTPKNLSPHDEDVEIYSNCREVELLLNGHSLGVKVINADAVPRVWRVPFASGRLKAVARNHGKTAATNELVTAGKPAKIILSTEARKLSPGWDNVAVVRATIVDANGVQIPRANDLITFKISGPGVIAAVDNGDNASHEIFQTNTRHAFQGECVAFVKATAKSGKIILTATAAGLKSGSVNFHAAKLDDRQ